MSAGVEVRALGVLSRGLQRPEFPGRLRCVRHARHKEGAISDGAHRQGVVAFEEQLVRQTKMPPNKKKAITHALGLFRDVNSGYGRR